jgi:hypothetical protein
LGGFSTLGRSGATRDRLGSISNTSNFTLYFIYFNDIEKLFKMITNTIAVCCTGRQSGIVLEKEDRCCTGKRSGTAPKKAHTGYTRRRSGSTLKKEHIYCTGRRSGNTLKKIYIVQRNDPEVCSRKRYVLYGGKMRKYIKKECICCTEKRSEGT